MNSRLAKLLIIATVASVALVPSVFAQMHFAGGHGSGHGPGMRPGPGGAFHPGFHGFGRIHRGGRFFGSSLYGNPYVLYPDYYDYGDYYDSEGPPPQPYPAQEYGDQATAQSAPPAPPADPLIIEYQGDEWVRVTNAGGPPASVEPAQTVTEERPESAGRRRMVRREPSAATPPPELPPAVLVFRDGHQEEVKGYTIMGSTLYTSADYWSTGSWTRQIRIAQLNVPATLKLNQQRGVKFSLPAGPSEIVMRP